MHRLFTFILLLAFVLQAMVHPTVFFLSTTFYDLQHKHAEYLKCKLIAHIADGKEEYINDHEVIINEKIYDVIAIYHKNEKTILYLFDDKEEQAQYNHYHAQKEKSKSGHNSLLVQLLFAESLRSIRFFLLSYHVIYQFILLPYSSPRYKPLHLPPCA